MNAEYYAQRSSAGLIISEGTAISPQAQGYPNAPGIYTAAQIAGWRIVTDVVIPTSVLRRAWLQLWRLRFMVVLGRIVAGFTEEVSMVAATVAGGN